MLEIYFNAFLSKASQCSKSFIVFHMGPFICYPSQYLTVGTTNNVTGVIVVIPFYHSNAKLEAPLYLSFIAWNTLALLDALTPKQYDPV